MSATDQPAPSAYLPPFPVTSGIRTAASREPDPGVSIIVPFFNEEACAQAVLREIQVQQPRAELIAVDDGSVDRTWEEITALPGVTALRLTRNRGQSAAIYAGLRAARGSICVLLDGDGQNDPADIEKLIDAVRSGSCDVACGRRTRRRDTWSRRAASRIANRVRRTFIHDGISDTGCSLKVFPKDFVDLLVPFNGMHRFLPAIFTHAGLRLAEFEVNHRPRSAGASKYTNWDRALRGIYDLVGVCWLLRRKILFPALECRGSREA